MGLMDDLKTVDPEISEAINAELNRQRHKLELIASENIVSEAVMKAQGSVLTNKYAEGLARDTMAAVSMLMWLSSWLLTVPRSSLVQAMLMYSLILVPRQIWQFSLPC